MDKKKIVIASDSFKGTLSSLEICRLFKNEIDESKIEAVYLPIADGGEGSIEAISNILKGHYVDIEVKDLYFNNIKTHFYIDESNNAYIETVSSSGLSLAKKDNDPGLVTTFGLGEQIKKAISLGCKNIYIFLGGSATNDGGVGLASALGTKFYNQNDELFIPVGLNLKDIKYIDNKEVNELLRGINIFALADVKSPLVGKEGASFVFSAQKGATKEEIILLDDGLKHLAKIVKRDLNIDISNIPGSGAAGGLGGGLLAFCHAKISSGINTILDLIIFDSLILDADLVISGEGKFDKQTYDGKVVNGVALRCLKYNKTLDLIVGVSEVSLEEAKKNYPCIRNIYETNYEHLPFIEVKKDSKNRYIKQIKNLFKNI